MATSDASLKVAAVCMLLLCVGSDLARGARPALASPSPDDQEAAAASALLRELLAQELAGELGLLVGEHVGDLCTPACQTCLIVCAITCVFNTNPAACFANCTVTNGCFGKTLLVA
ncbi:hypothetical protein HU200_037529 [Digitaria exilis]|uniref:Uncharacterized protein n=1 Tax=Digitaria exilis TaxID=1010633 RepID=A0A835BJX9_9POAL|nr:hypothetical protein HU200_037529 [Digitaria exilis]